jgi:2-methylfumaryl-CoA isomerase
VMVVALTERQWSALVETTKIELACHDLEHATGYDLSSESGRFQGRDLIAALLRPWFASRDLAAIRREFAGTNVSWGPYQTFRQLVSEDPRCSPANPMFAQVDQPGIGSNLMPGSPLDFSEVPRLPVRRAPILGENTDEVLSELLGLGAKEIGRLHDEGVVASANAAIR